MTSNTRDPHEIERDIERQRSELNSNLEHLQDRFSVEGVVRQIGEGFREHGGDFGRTLGEQVKANPIPLALTGIGLAWMMFGNSKAKAPVRTRDYDDTRNDLYRDPYRARDFDPTVDYERGAHYDDSPEASYRRAQLRSGRPYTPPAGYTSSTGTPDWAKDEDSTADRLTDNVANVRDSVASGASSAKDSVASGAASARDAAASGAQSVKSGASSAATAVSDSASRAGHAVSGAAGSARDAAASGVQSVRDGAARARARIAEGTEHLSEEGRKRVIAARERALDLRDSVAHRASVMRQRAARSASEGADAAADFYDRQPLVVGALAVAVGAALGGALPRTRMEDDYLGEYSDDMYAEAERIFQEEKAKAQTVVSSVKDEAKDIAADAKKDLETAAKTAGDKAKHAAKRVSDTAQEKAKEEDLGKPKT